MKKKLKSQDFGKGFGEDNLSGVKDLIANFF